MREPTVQRGSVTCLKSDSSPIMEVDLNSDNSNSKRKHHTLSVHASHHWTVMGHFISTSLEQFPGVEIGLT